MNESFDALRRKLTRGDAPTA